MNSQEMIDLCRKHTLYTWAATSKVAPLPIAKAEGIYFWDPEGKRYIDFNSQLMCVNIGHSHPRVIAAMKEALDGVIYTFPGSATEVRARFSQRLAELVPGDINTFFFTLGGAEANENAIKAARSFTGRFKILSRYRSYHGGTNACMQLTGDPRRLANEPGAVGFVKVMDPWPYEHSFGTDPGEVTRNYLRYLEEVIHYEGHDQIAAMFIETVTGTNGILPPPPGFLEGLRALLSKYGILLVCDEVMCGFGRTGKMFAFEHGGIVPDIVTMAKGLTSAYAPLGAMGVNDAIAAHFEDHVFWGGLTYNSHALSLAAANAAIDVLLDEDLVGNAARMGEIMRGEMQRLQERHPCIRETRNIGLFGAVEIRRNSKGERLVPYRGSHPAMVEFNKALRDRGLFTFVWLSTFFCNPPLSIDQEQLREGFAIIDDALAVLDAVYEG